MTSYWFIWTMFLILFAAKVFGFVTWSWWIITAPIWVPVAIALVVVVFLSGFVLVEKMVK